MVRVSEAHGWMERLARPLLLRTHSSELQGVKQTWVLDLAQRMGQMSSFRTRASVERIGSLPVVADPDQGRVALPCATVAEHSVDRPA